MNEQANSPGASAGRFFTTEQHVFMAIVTLATDLCFNPNEPNIEVRKSQILSACKLLENDQQLTPAGSRGVAQGVHIIKNLLHSVKGPPSTVRTSAHGVDSFRYQKAHEDLAAQNPSWDVPQLISEGSEWPTNNAVGMVSHGELARAAQMPSGQADFDGEYWSQLWSDFFEVAPDVDAPHWNSLLSDLDFSLGPA